MTVLNTAVASLSYPSLVGPLTYGVDISATPSASGLTGTVAYTQSGSWPTHLALDASGGTISGYSTVAGTYPFTVTATDVNGATASTSMTLTVNGTVAYSPPTTELLAGTPYSLAPTINAITGVTSWTVSSGSLPNGMTLGSSGTISGTPNTAGLYSFVVMAANGTQTAYSQTYTWSVIPTAGGDISYVSQPNPLTANTVYGAYNPTVTGLGTVTGFSITAGSVPAGMSFSASTGAFQGKPTTAGTSTFTVKATGSSASASVTLSEVVNGSLTYLLPGMLSTQQSYTSAPPTTVGITGITSWTIASGALPPGMSLSASGAITGTPTASGTYGFAVMAANATQAAYSPTYSVIVQSVPAATLAYTPTSLTVGTNSNVSAVISPAIAAGSTSFAITSGTKPSPMTFSSSTGIISGIPATAGTYPLTVQVTDGNNNSATDTFSLVVTGTLAYALPATLSTLQGYASAAPTLGGISGVTSWTVSSGALPPGMTLNSNGTISGTPAATGPYTFAVTASNATQTAVSPAYSVAVENIPAVSLSYSPTVIPAGTAVTVAPSGITGVSYALTSGTVPSPMGFTSGTGNIAGNPATAGTYPLTIQATDADNNTATASFTLTVTGGLTYKLPAALSTMQSYTSAAPTVSGNVSSVTSWTVSSGALPPGMTLGSNGAISGTPTTAGPYSFAITAANATQTAVSPTYSMVVQGVPAVWVTYPAIGALTLSTTLSNTYPAASASLNSPTYKKLGSFPPGMSFSTGGVISGKPTATGTYNFTVVATDTNNNTAAAAVTIVVN